MTDIIVRELESQFRSEIISFPMYVARRKRITGQSADQIFKHEVSENVERDDVPSDKMVNEYLQFKAEEGDGSAKLISEFPDFRAEAITLWGIYVSRIEKNIGNRSVRSIPVFNGDDFRAASNPYEHSVAIADTGTPANSLVSYYPHCEELTIWIDGNYLNDVDRLFDDTGEWVGTEPTLELTRISDRENALQIPENSFDFARWKDVSPEKLWKAWYEVHKKE